MHDVKMEALMVSYREIGGEGIKVGLASLPGVN